MLLLNGIQTERPIIGVDWSRTEIKVYDPRTRGVRTFSTLEEAAPFYKGAFLVLESTTESYELQRRQIVLDAFEKNDIEAWGFKTDRTAQFRIKNKVKKSDAGDAKTIYRIATETKIALHRLGPLTQNDPIRDKIKNFLVKDRYAYDGEKSRALAEKLIKNVPEEFKQFIFSGKEYRKQVGRILAVAQEVRRAKRGYREFRRQLGNYGNGYASMPRSEYYWWWVRVVLNARLKALGIEKKYTKIQDAASGKEEKLRKWTAKELELKTQIMRQAVKAAQYLWRATA